MARMLAKLRAVDVDEFIYVWPEYEPVWLHWQALQTQWRVGGMGGATGLDYAGVRAYLDEVGLSPGEERRELWACLVACELEALNAWAAIRDKRQSVENK